MGGLPSEQEKYSLNISHPEISNPRHDHLSTHPLNQHRNSVTTIIQDLYNTNVNG